MREWARWLKWLAAVAVLGTVGLAAAIASLLAGLSLATAGAVAAGVAATAGVAAPFVIDRLLPDSASRAGDPSPEKVGARAVASPGGQVHSAGFLRELPTDVGDDYFRQSARGRKLLELERWDEAFDLFCWVFERLMDAQPEGGRFHKGSPLRYMGVARLQSGLPAEGLRWTLLAFIEDALTRAEEAPGHLDELQRPAANLLRLLGMGEKELYGLAERVRALVREGELVSDPTTVFVAENLDQQVRLFAQGPIRGATREEHEIRVFVSSPGDLRAERLLVVEVCRELSSALGIRIRALLWEGGGPRNPEVQPFPPDVTGQAAQAVLDQYVWDALGGYDIYVGMIWKRMGTPTGRWRSGTEAELRYALRVRGERGWPMRIAFYRKMSRPSDLADPEVARFVAELESIGLVQSFATRADLRRMLLDHLSSVARQTIGAQSGVDGSSGGVAAHLRQRLVFLPSKQLPGTVGAAAGSGEVDVTGRTTLEQAKRKGLHGLGSGTLRIEPATTSDLSLRPRTNTSSSARHAFLSYSGEDSAVAEQVCSLLEGRGIPCWIAPRDVLPGRDYGEQIIEAIESTRVMVLILTQHANASVFVVNEVERAVSKGKVLIPFRTENVQPSRALELFVSRSQWIDAWAPPLGPRVAVLGAAIRGLLGLSSLEEPGGHSSAHEDP